MSDFSFQSSDVHWIGDGDSACASDVEKIRAQLEGSGDILQTHRLQCDKDASDFAVALDLIGEKFAETQQLILELYGACGGRFDHALITYQEAVKWVAQRSNGASIIADFGVVTNHTASVFLKEGSTFSVINFSNVTGDSTVHMIGARYHGDIKLLRPSSGLSNVVEKVPITFSPSAGAAILLWNLESI